MDSRAEFSIKPCRIGWKKVCRQLSHPYCALKIPSVVGSPCVAFVSTDEIGGPGTVSFPEFRARDFCLQPERIS